MIQFSAVSVTSEEFFLNGSATHLQGRPFRLFGVCNHCFTGLFGRFGQRDLGEPFAPLAGKRADPLPHWQLTTETGNSFECS
jgi:hypothetical protein